jgi:hypothetical protein
LVAAALEKQRCGQTPNRAESAALRGYQREREEEDRQRHYAAIPQKHWAALSGRQPKVLNEQAIRYGVPVGQAVIDLGKVARWLHELLRTRGPQILREDEDGEVGGPNSPNLERLRREKWRLAKLDRLQREGNLLPREDVHELLLAVAEALRSTTDRLQRRYGDDAADVVNEAVARIGEMVEAAMSDATNGRP